MVFFKLTGGLLFLMVGAEALVQGAARLAAAVGVSPLIIGLTVVAFGTSAPEMAVSTLSGLAGNADIALGNVVGSNIFNVLMILGMSALVAPLAVSAQLVRVDVPVMIAVSVLTLVLGADGKVSRLDGAFLFMLIIIYTAALIFFGRKQANKTQDAVSLPLIRLSSIGKKRFLIDPAWIVIGLIMLVIGSRWFVQGAVTIAGYFGVSELVIGLTIVAAGTSLPELATSVVASIRGERDIAVGNVVGSNIFNLLAVLGVSAMVSRQGITISKAALHFDMPVMIAAALACLPVFFTGNVISRLEGGVFLGYYAAYVLYLYLETTRNHMLPFFSTAMAWFVLPMTMLTLVIVVMLKVRSWKKQK